MKYVWRRGFAAGRSSAGIPAHRESRNSCHIASPAVELTSVVSFNGFIALGSGVQSALVKDAGNLSIGVVIQESFDEFGPRIVARMQRHIGTRQRFIQTRNYSAKSIWLCGPKDVDTRHRTPAAILRRSIGIAGILS